jgi:DNA integrity scanning protein DisA with diadenylate cyclase activity
VKPLSRCLVRHAHAIAREVGAKAVLLYADVVEDEQDVSDLVQDVDFRVILVTRRSEVVSPEGWGDLCKVVRVPDLKMTRAGRIKLALLVAAAEGLVRAGERIVCTTGIDRSGRVDTIMVLELGSELELVADLAAEPLPADVTPPVFQRMLTLAGELGAEGREGRPVGTLFVLGDCESVLEQSRQLVINPFFGYPESERNILDPRLEETIKEFSAIDGAFVIRGDGVVLSAGRYLSPAAKPEEPLSQGLGTRHEAAASITVTTQALALCISQSTGTVSIYRRGRLMTDIAKPRSLVADGL